jgi:hypothetical protein
LPLKLLYSVATRSPLEPSAFTAKIS